MDSRWFESHRHGQYKECKKLSDSEASEFKPENNFSKIYMPAVILWIYCTVRILHHYLWSDVFPFCVSCLQLEASVGKATRYFVLVLIFRGGVPLVFSD